MHRLLLTPPRWDNFYPKIVASFLPVGPWAIDCTFVILRLVWSFIWFFWDGFHFLSRFMLRNPTPCSWSKFFISVIDWILNFRDAFYFLAITICNTTIRKKYIIYADYIQTGLLVISFSSSYPILCALDTKGGPQIFAKQHLLRSVHKVNGNWHGTQGIHTLWKLHLIHIWSIWLPWTQWSWHPSLRIYTPVMYNDRNVFLNMAWS